MPNLEKMSPTRIALELFPQSAFYGVADILQKRGISCAKAPVPNRCWAEWGASNSRPQGPKPCALPTELHPEISATVFFGFPSPQRPRLAKRRRKMVLQTLLRPWQPRLDSNQCVAESKSDALPLGYGAVFLTGLF